MAEYISFQPSDFFNTVLYTGNGSTQTISGVGFQGDLTWIKARGSTDWHCIVDTVRGYDKYIYSNDTSVEYTSTTRLTSWNADGFALGSQGETNTNAGTYVAWNWKAGTTTGIAGSPSITPTAYSFNQTSGFSVVSYTANNTAGATIPHGLGVVPDMAIFKCTSYAENWSVYHKNLTGGRDGLNQVFLNKTNAQSTTDNFYDTAPTSTLFYMNNGGEVNESTRTYVAYFFASKKGYSKFGSYKGNGNADGPFVFTGFRPAFVMIKSSGGVETWNMWDNKRSTSGSNLTNMNLHPDSNAAENTATAPGGQVIDILSNGFKIRGTTTETNQSAYNMIYMAFAEFPFVSSNSKAGVAR